MRLKRENQTGPVVVVTGSSAGLGRAIALRFAKGGGAKNRIAFAECGPSRKFKKGDRTFRQQSASNSNGCPTKMKCFVQLMKLKKTWAD